MLLKLAVQRFIGIPLLFLSVTLTAMVSLATPQSPQKPSRSKPPNQSKLATRYKPPQRPSRPKPSSLSTAAVRTACLVKDPDSQADPSITKASSWLVPIAPRAYVGQTTSTHPTFVWFVPERQSYTIEFALYDISAGVALSDPIYVSNIKSHYGIMMHSLPQDKAALSVGKRYAWFVNLICDPNRPSKNKFVIRELEVVAPSTALNVIPNEQERITRYAESGLWYDALTTAWMLPNQAQRQDWVRSLLDDLAITETDPNVIQSLNQMKLELFDR